MVGKAVIGITFLSTAQRNLTASDQTISICTCQRFSDRSIEHKIVRCEMLGAYIKRCTRIFDEPTKCHPFRSLARFFGESVKTYANITVLRFLCRYLAHIDCTLRHSIKIYQKLLKLYEIKWKNF